MAGSDHSSPFRPHARLISILGENLIRDQAVGLVELVKNSYDADAQTVTIRLESTAQPTKSKLTVEDDGFGMTIEDVTKKWLSPAVGHKEQDKLSGKRTPAGRIPIGEKGVGRFAAQQIGRGLEMITRARGRKEVLVRIDWDDFDTDKFLDEIKVDASEREAKVFVGDATGTRLTVTRHRAEWSEAMVKRVHYTLRKLQTPLVRRKPPFAVSLEVPEFPMYENLDPTDIQSKAHYVFKAFVDEEGICEYEYSCVHPQVRKRSKTAREDLVALDEALQERRPPRCGTFKLNLYVWDRSSDNLHASGVSRSELDAQCGVSVYRDGLRVLPYGDPGDDWLFLDQARIQDPSERLSNNQVIGHVLLDQKSNLELKDKTNREGLIENQGFLDLRALVKGTITLFTACWKKDRPAKPDRPERPKGVLEKAVALTGAIGASASDEISVNLPDGVISGGAASTQRSTAGGSEEPVTQKHAVQLLADELGAFSAEEADRKNELDVLLHLAATGLAAERVVHEFGRQVGAAKKALADLKGNANVVELGKRELKTLAACLETLSNEFTVLAPYEVAARSPKAAETSIRDVAELALTLNRQAIAEGRVKASVAGGELRVRSKPTLLLQILDNLVNNACYWVTAIPLGNERRVGILIDEEGQRILVADNGPGVHEEAVESLFQPFFTMRAGGRGLGLYISRVLAGTINANLNLAIDIDKKGVPSWASGAVFVLSFGDEVKSGRGRA
jgi:hypothetical protein